MTKSKLSLLAGMLALTVALGGCSGSNMAGGGGGKVATVDGTVITKAEYDKTFNDFQKAFNLEKMENAQQKQMLMETIKQMTLNKLIMNTLIRNESQKLGVTVTAEDVAKYKQEELFKNPAVKQQFKEFLNQNKLTEAEFDEMLKDNILLNKFIEKKAGPTVQVSDAEVKEFYTKNQAQFKIPERIKAKHILVKAIEPQMKEEIKTQNTKLSDAEIAKQVDEKKATLKTEAEKLYSEVKTDPKKFGTLAKEHSDDTVSAAQGGDLGYMVEANIDPVFWQAVEKTKPGMLYPGVLATQFGYHIIQVEEHAKPHTQSFEEAKDMIKEHLGQQKKNAFLTQWAEAQKASTKIAIEPAYQPTQPQAGPGGAPQGMPMQGAGGPQPAPQQQKAAQ